MAAPGIVEILGIAASVSLLAGWRLYLCVLATGIAMRLGVVPLPDHLAALDVLANPWVMGIAAFGATAEFFADKVAWLDSAWDAVHTLVRPLGGALLALAIVDPSDPAMQVIAFLLGGGGALLSHGGKAGARAVVNASPEPFNNIAASTVEDVATAPPASRIRPGWRAALLPGYPAPACAAAGSRVFHSDQPIPAARIANVTPSDTGGGILTRPNISATKILAPINTSSTARAYFR